MARLTEIELNDALETFALFDKKGDNKLEARQIGEVVRALGLNPTEAEIKKCGYNNPDERISFEIFIPIYQSLMKQKVNSDPSEFVEGFKVFDKDGNGMISAAELRHLLTAIGERLRENEVDALLAGMENSQGQINYEDFVHHIMN